MTQTHYVVLALVLLAVSLVGASAPAAPGPSLQSLLRALEIAPLAGEPPAFTLPGLDGNPRALADIKGQVALLYFWATW